MNTSFIVNQRSGLRANQGSSGRGAVLASLDIGSSLVKIIYSTVNSEGQIEVVGVGHAPNSGLKQGVVVNIEATT